MLVKWFGECSFLLQDSLGRRIITDPPNTTSLKSLLEFNPNILTLSHCYPDAVSSILVEKKLQLVDKAIKYKLNLCNIAGIHSFQDSLEGQKRGPNIIYTYTFDNLKICNLGYLGHPLTDDILSSLRNIDLLFVPIGGNFTINFMEAVRIVNKLNPKIIIPMHYRTPNSLIYLDSCKNFIVSMKSIIKVTDDSFDTTSLDPESFPVTLILKEIKLNEAQKKVV